jgi:hypothetical protein
MADTLNSHNSQSMRGLGAMQIEELGWSADALDRLSELREAREVIDWMIERAVVECRTNAQHDTIDVVGNETRTGTVATPISWDRIAKALGVSRQTAWQRFRYDV